VFGPVGDDTDASFRQRHGIQQGKKTFTLFISSLKTHVRHRVGGVGLRLKDYCGCRRHLGSACVISFQVI
jgi:hypothetical protein